jgi:hypothetical protein
MGCYIITSMLCSRVTLNSGTSDWFLATPASPHRLNIAWQAPSVHHDISQSETRLLGNSGKFQDENHIVIKGEYPCFATKYTQQVQHNHLTIMWTNCFYRLLENLWRSSLISKIVLQIEIPSRTPNFNAAHMHYSACLRKQSTMLSVTEWTGSRLLCRIPACRRRGPPHAISS